MSKVRVTVVVEVDKDSIQAKRADEHGKLKEHIDTEVRFGIRGALSNYGTTVSNDEFMSGTTWKYMVEET